MDEFREKLRFANNLVYREKNIQKARKAYLGLLREYPEKAIAYNHLGGVFSKIDREKRVSLKGCQECIYEMIYPSETIIRKPPKYVKAILSDEQRLLLDTAI